MGDDGQIALLPSSPFACLHVGVRFMLQQPLDALGVPEADRLMQRREAHQVVAQAQRLVAQEPHQQLAMALLRRHRDGRGARVVLQLQGGAAAEQRQAQGQRAVRGAQVQRRLTSQKGKGKGSKRTRCPKRS